MKELYTRPEIEIEIFETEDIITTSGDDNLGKYDPEWDLTGASLAEDDKSR